MKIEPVCLEQVVARTGAQAVGKHLDAQVRIERVLIDSRSFSRAEHCLFVALVGRNNDGHRYIEPLYQKGVRYFLVSEAPAVAGWEERMPEAVFLVVPDTLKALQGWARNHRERFSFPVVGITGSNGKTWVKEWLAYLLHFDKNPVASPKSFNSQIGVPLSVLQMGGSHDIGIFEAGISQGGEMENLQKIVRPTIGIFTNIGAAHDAGFAGRDEKIREKLKFFQGTDTLIYSADYTDIMREISRAEHLRGVRLLSFSCTSDTEADLRLVARERIENGMLLRALYQGEELALRIPFFDKASIENALSCWLFMLVSGYPQTEIARRFLGLPAVEMRMEIKEGIYNSFVVSDVYNSDFNSFTIALDFLCGYGRGHHRCVVCSDILQSALSEKELYGDVAEALAARGIEEFVGVGRALTRHSSLFTAIPNARFYPDTQAFLADFKPADYAGKAVLLKGARPFAFEKISALLQKRVHETVMEVNLTALVHNLNFFRSLIKPETKLMVMGKAFSYGSGSHEIADVLEYNHVDYVTVAYPDEAVALRRNGIQLPIMCMNPESGGMETLLQENVEPVIYGYGVLDSLQAYLDNVGETRPARVKIHLAFDTGMHRMGFEEADTETLLTRLRNEPRIKVESVFTHLATADMPEMEMYTRRQLECFERVSARILAVFPYKIMRHCLNTAGIFHFPEYQYDMVRLGIGLYGVGTDEAMQAHLENVSTLKTSVSLIRSIKKGEAVGYGRRFVAERDTTVAVIGIGYADGLNRRLGNGNGKVWINGSLVPIIGSICMDMCMIDVTDVEAREKDTVIIFGKEHPVSHAAEALGTIPYEVLTGISPRVPRVYFQE